MKVFSLALLRGVLVLLLGTSALRAQVDQGQLHVGLILGLPIGLGLSFQVDSPRIGLDGAFGWDFSGAVPLQAHAILGRFPLDGVVEGATEQSWYYGVGGTLRLTDQRSDLVIGPSALAGLSVETKQVELFGQFTPILSLYPETQLLLGVAAGVRLAF